MAPALAFGQMSSCYEFAGRSTGGKIGGCVECCDLKFDR